MRGPTGSRKRVAAFATAGLLSLGGLSGIAVASSAAASGTKALAAAGGPTSAQLRAIGSSSKAARTQPGFGATLGSLPAGQPLIVIAFGAKGITVGGTAIGRTQVPVSAAECFVNFTQRKARVAHRNLTNVRWFGGIGCSRQMTLFGQAFLAQGASKSSGTGNFYNGRLTTASSGRSNTSIAAANPSLYIWHATNIYFPERPTRGVLAIIPRSGQKFNGASSCHAVRSPKYGIGVHCDLYSERF
jgi:hypothetical protein